MKKFIVVFLLLASVAIADNVFDVPVVFTTGSSVDMGATVPLTGTWDFGGATLLNLPGQSITLTGNVTGTGTGTIATTVVTIPDLVQSPGSIVSTNIAAPVAPGSGRTKWFTDSTDKRFHDRNDTGSTGTTVVPSAPVSHQFVTGISSAGAVVRSQPSFSDISGALLVGQGAVPPGGSTDFVLTKVSAADFDLAWKARGGVAALANTLDQSSAAEVAHISFTVPANSCRVGTVYRVVAWGDMDNGTTAITFTPRLRWGGASGVQLIATPTVVGTTTAQSNKTWKANAEITFRTVGATGTAFCSLKVSNHTASSSGVYGTDEADSGGTGVTVDTTVNKDLAFTWQLSATTGTPHVRTYGGYVELVKP